MEYLTHYSVLAAVLCVVFLSAVESASSVRRNELAIRQSWTLADNGSGLLPILKVKSECGSGEITLIRIAVGFQSVQNKDDNDYLKTRGSCSESKQEELLDELKDDITECYRTSSCNTVTLLGYYTSLVENGCSICKEGRSNCIPVTKRILRTRATVTFEAVCKVKLKDHQLATVTKLNLTPPTEFNQKKIPIGQCQCHMTIDNLILSNACPKPLRTKDFEVTRQTKLINELESCLRDVNCNSTLILSEGVICPSSGEVKADDAIVIIWSCPSPTPTTESTDELKTRVNRYRVGLIVCAVLLAMSLLCLIPITIYLLRRRQLQLNSCTCNTNMTSNINNNEESITYENATSSRQSQTLQKYQQPVHNEADYHCYAGLRLPKQNSEELYEYVDPDGTSLTKPSTVIGT